MIFFIAHSLYLFKYTIRLLVLVVTKRSTIDFPNFIHIGVLEYSEGVNHYRIMLISVSLFIFDSFFPNFGEYLVSFIFV